MADSISPPRSPSTSNIRQPEQDRTANAIKNHKNSFLGVDAAAPFKAMISVRTMVGVGILLASFLPRTLGILLAILFTLPQLITTLARRYKIIRDPVREVNPVLRGRYSGELTGDFCVFHIGLVLNEQIPSKEAKKVGDAFTAMLLELESNREKYGFFGSTSFSSLNFQVNGIMSIQYWRSQEDLNAYARNGMAKHFPNMIWSAGVVKLSPNFGIWHESFRVRDGEYESIYVNCPRILLGKAGKLVEAKGRRRTARGRLGVTDGGDLSAYGMPESY
jgi:hypothetical protein